MKLIYDERYGTVSYAQRAAYRKFNVSPSDHQYLADRYGESNHDTITQAVKDYSRNGQFSWYELQQANSKGWW